MARTTMTKAVESVSAADAEVTRSLGAYADSLPGRALSRIGKLGDQPELRLISGAVVAAALVIGNARLLRAGVRMFVAHELATATKDFVKRRIDRARPRAARSSAKARPGRSTAKEMTSFPSGHSAGAVAVAQAFAREFPEHRLPALGAAALIAGAQVPKCAHYPSDIAAGALIGAASEAVIGGFWPERPDPTREGLPQPPLRV